MTALMIPDRTLPGRISHDAVLGALMGSLTAHTRRAYAGDYRDFATFLGTPGASEAASAFLALDGPGANMTLLAYRTDLTDRGLSPATVGRRLSALKTLAQWARILGLIAWTPEVKCPRSEGYRDTRGPGPDGWEAMLSIVRREADSGDTKAIRDHAIVRMLHDLGLRRGELCELDLEDLDQKAGTVAVIGKGRTQKSNHTLPEPTIRALASWLAVRGFEPGPLFMGLDHRSKGSTRLAGESVRRIVRDLGLEAEVGRAVRPHGLRHQAITAVLEKMNGNLEYGMKFARHANPRTTMAYNDNRRDVAGEMARLVAGD